MTTIITSASKKGGVGKTTFAVTAAAALARAGYSVILLDLDGQGNATASTGLDMRGDVYALLVDGEEWADLLRPAPVEFAGKGDLYVLSSDASTDNVVGIAGIQQALHDRLQLLRQAGADVVIIDTAPGNTDLHMGCYFASDYVMIPTLCEVDAVEGVGQTIAHITRARELGAGIPVAQVGGILPTRLNVTTKDMWFMLGELSGRFYSHYVFKEVIRENPAWRLARQERRSVYTWKPSEHRDRANRKRAAGDFEPVVARLVELIGAHDE